MEDYDVIEIAYLFDTEPYLHALTSLFDEFPQHSGPEYGSEEFNINSWADDGGKQHKYDDYRVAAKTLSSSKTASIGVWMDRYELNVTKNQMDDWLLSGIPHLTFSATIYAFEQPDEEEQIQAVERRREEFASILARAASCLEPEWGFGRRGGIAIGETDSVTSLCSATTPPLYEYNVFRAETVGQLSRERLRSAPVWFTEELDTGGVFLAVREPPKTCWKKTKSCIEVADHLGIPLAEPERYH